MVVRGLVQVCEKGARQRIMETSSTFVVRLIGHHKGMKRTRQLQNLVHNRIVVGPGLLLAL